ncbi:MAG TPA: condensation domain-containing protein, partial [Chloroflexota bacterium]|nr:condensation domain-containing protein [Chloroflexota bacterium]
MTQTASAPTAIEDVYELSPVQEGMLFYSAAGPESGTYVVQFRCRLSGPLHDAAFERAWQGVLRRHPILRTSFHWREAEKPLQVVHRSVPLSLHREDWRGRPPQAQEDALHAYLARDRRLGFPLEEAPLLRLALFRLAEETHELVWSLHHLLLDGWSLALVLQDLLALYEAARGGTPVLLPPSRPFGDYVEWLQSQDLSQAEAYWRAALAGITAATPLPLSAFPAPGGPAPEGPAPAPGERQVELSAVATAALGDLSRRHQVTLSTVVQGAWALLLGRHCGLADVVFGLTVSGRPADLQGVESMVGMFINTLPVRVRVDPGEPLVPWLRRLQAQQAELRQFEYTPLVRLHGWTGLPPRAPLFESIVVFENYPVGGALQEGSSLEVSASGAVEQTNYPLSLVAGPGERLALKLLYDPARYAPQTAERLLGHLRTLLEGMAAAQEGRLGDLPLLPPAERRQVVVDWNATASLYPRDATVHQLVAAQAARAPQAVAVVDGGATLTYGDLEAQANRLAQHLLALGIDPEDRVGVCLGRSAGAVVALLAVLKAGAVYVPLDPAYPPARLASMLEDAGARVVLSAGESAAGLPLAGEGETHPDRPAHLVRLDDPLEALAIAARPDTPPRIAVAPEGLA